MALTDGVPRGQERSVSETAEVVWNLREKKSEVLKYAGTVRLEGKFHPPFGTWSLNSATSFSRRCWRCGSLVLAPNDVK